MIGAGEPVRWLAEVKGQFLGILRILMLVELVIWSIRQNQYGRTYQSSG